MNCKQEIALYMAMIYLIGPITLHIINFAIMITHDSYHTTLYVMNVMHTLVFITTVGYLMVATCGLLAIQIMEDLQ